MVCVPTSRSGIGINDTLSDGLLVEFSHGESRFVLLTFV